MSYLVTLLQLKDACTREFPGYVIVNLQEPNHPAWGNSQFKCVSPHSSNNFMLTNGLPPSWRDVSTTQPGKPFYAVPNFVGYIDNNTGASCGMPCWAPVHPTAYVPTPYQLKHPERFSHLLAITTGWPCQAYLPATGYCTNPPPGRTAAERWVPGFAYSGDKLEVVCQVQGEQITYGTGLAPSTWWDGIAVPVSKLNELAHHDKLKPVPHMPGLVIGFISDVELGGTNNSGQHQLPPC
jgi:hypothetical protein